MGINNDLTLSKESSIIRESGDNEGNIDWNTSIPEWEADMIWNARNTPHRLKTLANGNWYYVPEKEKIGDTILDMYAVLNKNNQRYSISAEIVEIKESLRKISGDTHIKIISPFIRKALQLWIKRWVYNKTPLWWSIILEIYKEITNLNHKISYRQSEHDPKELENNKYGAKYNVFKHELYKISINNQIIHSKMTERTINDQSKIEFVKSTYNNTQGKITNSNFEEILAHYWKNKTLPFTMRRIHFMARRQLWPTNQRLHLIGKLDKPYCNICLEKVESTYHVLNECVITKKLKMNKHDEIVLEITEWLIKKGIINDKYTTETFFNEMIDIANTKCKIQTGYNDYT